MQGAKGVIISIIGGEDMKLLEVDEAANHIRELVDPDANIIWGSAFNPDLDGKIRVSVVATGIEQSAEMAHRPPASRSLCASRAPKKPVLPLPTEEELAEDASPPRRDSPPVARDEEPTTRRRRAVRRPPLPEATTPARTRKTKRKKRRETDGLAEPADDSQFGNATRRLRSLGAMRIDREPKAHGGREDWDEGGEGEATRRSS
jgi:cell division protein FtsZ